MKAKKIIFSIEKEVVRTRALIIGGKNFLGAAFTKKFTQRGVEVIDWESLTEVEKTPLDFDYLVFIFKQGELEDFFKKEEKGWGNRRAKLLFLSPLANFSQATRQEWQNFLKEKEIDGRLVFFTNLYGPGMDFSEETTFNAFLRPALEGELRVRGEGLEKCYPTFIEDFIEGAWRATFFQGTKGEIFFLINAEDLTILDLAYFLQRRILPKGVDIEFMEGEEKGRLPLNKELLLESGRAINWQPKTDLREGLLRTVRWYRGRHERPRKLRQEERKEEIIDTKDHEKTTKKRKIKFLVVPLLLLLIILFPFLRFGWQVGWGGLDLQQTREFLEKGDFVQAEKKVVASQQHWLLAKEQLNESYLLSWLPLGEYRSQLEKMMAVTGDFCQASRHLLLAGKSLQKVWQFVFSKTEEKINLSESLREASDELKAAYEEFSFIEGTLASLELEKWGKWPGMKKLILMKKELPQMRQKLATIYPLLPTLEKVLGTEEEKIYLILFQNNMELRPTGGFIGSYGLLTFSNGKFVDLKVEDVYAADGQLKGHVEPPEPIRIYLNEASWYLRDSNWEVDFFQSALNASWFLEKAMGVVVNGVIGVNLYVMEEILAGMGPIWLADYEEEITAENLFLKAESYVEKDFFPGSTQKKDFLGSLARQLFEKIKTAGVTEQLKLGEAIYKSLEEKQILLSLDEKEAMVVINRFGWDGDFRKFPCQTIFGVGEAGRICVADYTYFVEANLGVNKANYFLKRGVREKMEIKEAEVQRTLEIFYENTSTSNLWPSGDYKNYLRVMVPAEARLGQITVDGTEIEKVDEEWLRGVRSSGFLVLVPVGEKRKVSFKYFLPMGKVERKFSYFLSIQKQPGIGADPLEVTVTYPQGWELKSQSPIGLTGKQAIVYNTNLSRDRLFKVEFEVKR